MAGAVALHSHQFYIESFELKKENICDWHTNDEDKRRAILILKRQGVCLMVSGILCLINSILYFLDVAWSIRYTLASL